MLAYVGNQHITMGSFNTPKLIVGIDYEDLITVKMIYFVLNNAESYCCCCYWNF